MFGFDDWGDAPPAAIAPLHPATTALIARMAPAPSSTRAGQIDALVRALTSAEIWDKLESLHVPAAHSQQAALLDWTGSRGTASIGGGTPAFVKDRGVYCDGADDWIDLGFAPADGIRFQQNSAMIAVWTRNASAGQGISGFGLAGSTAVGLNPRGSSGVMASRLNSAGATTSAVVDTGEGLSAADRSSATSVQHYRNGAASGAAGTATSAAPATQRFSLGRGGTGYGANQFAAVAIGAHLTTAEHAALHGALAGYMTALGVPALPVAVRARSIAAAVTLPDGGSGSVGGKGWTCTGLARLADGSWLVGNDGRGASATDPNIASVIHLAGDGSAILHQWTLAGWNLPAGSIQGVAWEPPTSSGHGTLWFVLVGGASGAYRAEIAEDWSVGAAMLLPGSAGANGITYDSVRDRIVLLGAQISWRDKTSGSVAGPVSAIHLVEPDHLFHDPVSDRLFYSFGANGQSGGIAELDPKGVADYGAPILCSLTTLAGADAVEGIVRADGAWHAANDAFFHSGNPALNRLLRFSD